MNINTEHHVFCSTIFSFFLPDLKSSISLYFEIDTELKIITIINVIAKKTEVSIQALLENTNSNFVTLTSMAFAIIPDKL